MGRDLWIQRCVNLRHCCSSSLPVELPSTPVRCNKTNADLLTLRTRKTAELASSGAKSSALLNNCFCRLKLRIICSCTGSVFDRRVQPGPRTLCGKHSNASIGSMRLRSIPFVGSRANPKEMEIRM